MAFLKLISHLPSVHLWLSSNHLRHSVRDLGRIELGGVSIIPRNAAYWFALAQVGWINKTKGIGNLANYSLAWRFLRRYLEKILHESGQCVNISEASPHGFRCGFDMPLSSHGVRHTDNDLALYKTTDHLWKIRLPPI
jgi:hypothetical protein